MIYVYIFCDIEIFISMLYQISHKKKKKKKKKHVLEKSHFDSRMFFCPNFQNE